mgnify:CR=1 FL=1
MSKKTSKKIYTSNFFSRYRKQAIVVILLLMAIITAITIAELTNKNKGSSSTSEIKNDVTDNTNIDPNIINDLITSNENIIYIAPKVLYEDDFVEISVTSHVESKIHGQGIRFSYKNKSTNDIKVSVMPADNTVYEENEVIVEPGDRRAFVYYLGQDAERFSEGRYIFTITIESNKYSTDVVTVEAKH